MKMKSLTTLTLTGLMIAIMAVPVLAAWFDKAWRPSEIELVKL